MTVDAGDKGIVDLDKLRGKIFEWESTHAGVHKSNKVQVI